MTENTQKEQFSIAYVRALAAVTGVKVTKEEVDDDSVDVTLSVSAGASSKMDVQLKCSGVLKKTGNRFPFPSQVEEL
jgi:mevalonate kinase